MAKGPDNGVTYFLTVDMAYPDDHVLRLLKNTKVLLEHAGYSPLAVTIESEGYGDCEYEMREEE